VRELAGWLSAEVSDGRPRVVTGGPGSGKSAVLARVVTLADPTWRREVLATTRSAKIDPALLPPEGVVNVAVHARHKLLADVVQQLAVGLGFAVRDSTGLLDAVARKAGKTVIVIDALDEADDRDQIISRLLRPLAELPPVFLLVGTRPDSSERGNRFRALGQNVVELDLDHTRYIGPADIACYVERRLLAAEEPNRLTLYRDVPDTAYTVARAVAQRARNVFLVASTTVHALLSAPSIVDVTEPGWVERLPTGLNSAFAQFLAQIDTRQPDGLSSETARAVLLPLAFAEGEGLPWVDVWASAASALSDLNISDFDVALIRKHAAPFIVEAVEQDRSVYRLYHERIAELLRDSVSAQRAQQDLTIALASRVPGRLAAGRPDWTRAHPYILRHLAAHALKGGKLEDLARDGSFLAAADPQRILQVLSEALDPLIRRVYACYLLAFDRMNDEPHEIRLSYLQMVARQLSDDELADIWRGSGISPLWSVPWAHFLPLTPHRKLMVDAGVKSVVLGSLDGRPIIVAVAKDATVHLWDLASGKRSGAPLHDQDGSVTSVAWGALSERPVIVSGSNDGTVRLWDGGSGKQRGKTLHGHKGSVTSLMLASLDSRAIVVTGGEDGTVRMWDTVAGSQLGEPLQHAGAITTVTWGSVDGRPVIISVSKYEQTHVWDMATGTPQHWPPLTDYTAAARPENVPDYESGKVNAIALGELDGWPVIVTGGNDIRVWVRHSSNDLELLHFYREDVTSIVLGTLEGRPIAVSGGVDGTVRVWDLASGEQRCEPLRGHEGAVTSVAFGDLRGRPVIVSSGEDNTVRIWDPAWGEGRKARADHESLATAVASLSLGSVDDKAIIVSGGQDSVVRLWDLATGQERDEILFGHNGPVVSVALGALRGGSIVVSAERGHSHAWHLPSCERSDDFLYSHGCHVTSLVSGTLSERPIIVSGSNDGTVRLWDGASGKQRGKALHGHRGSVISVALSMLYDLPIVISGGVDGTVRVWELHVNSFTFLFHSVSGKQRGDPLGSHGSPVTSVTMGCFDGHPVIISGGRDNAVRVWDLTSGKLRGELLHAHRAPVTSVAVGTFADRPVIISGGEDNTVRVWNSAVRFSEGDFAK
jgi:WD40 repeat protein